MERAQGVIRRRRAWWLPVSLPPGLPFDVALWLLELRHCADADEPCRACADDDDGDDDGDSAPLAAAASWTPGTASIRYGERGEERSTPHGGRGRRLSLTEFPVLGEEGARCFFWNPAYLGIEPADPSLSRRGGPCTDQGETSFRKLCQKAIEDLHVLLEQGNEVANSPQSRASPVCDEEADACVQGRECAQDTFCREVDRSEDGAELLSDLYDERVGQDLWCRVGSDSAASSECPSSFDGQSVLTQPGETDVDEFCCIPRHFITEIASLLSTDNVEEECEGKIGVSCEMLCCDPTLKFNVENQISQLECMVPSLEGMEDSNPRINVEILDAECSDFYLLCDNTNSLIEETLEHFHQFPQHRVLKSQISHSTVESTPSDDVFMQSDCQLSDEDCSLITQANNSSKYLEEVSVSDINSIFDNGHTIPVAPPRKNKIKKLKLANDTMSSNSEEKSDHSITDSVHVLDQSSRSVLRSGNSRERKSRSFYCENSHHDASKTMRSSLQNLVLCTESELKSESTEIESEECEKCSNSSLLEVNVSLAKPVSSFVFPAASDTRESSPSPRDGKQNVHCMSSLEDFISFGRGRKGSGSSDIAAWKRDLQRSGLFSQDDDYLPSEEWFSSTDGEGRVYFFEENSSESSWTLPNIVVSKDEEGGRAAETDQHLEASHLNLRHSDGEKNMRKRARSMFLSDQKHKESSAKTSSIPRDWVQRYGLDKDVVKYGNMNRTKITENGKKMSKKWASAYVVLTNDTLCFYKDHKSPQHSMGLQPEMSMQLSGARVEPGDKLSSRKYVLLVTSGSLQVLCECDSAEGAAQWQEAMASAIAKLNKPAVQEKPKTTSIERSKSLHVRSREGNPEEHTTSNEEQQTKIRDRLKKFFHRRPTRESLASKGIYKDEPVFDSHLKKVCSPTPPYIPEFVRLCIAAIEAKEDNMKTDGLYRASGNLSHVQKIRLRVDQNDLSVLAAEDDVHVLTGALKLFFRELKEPLIPYELFNKAISAGGMMGDRKEKVKMFREIVKQLPPPNHDTLKFLLKHLKRVTEYEEFNRMQIPNIAIVFGPTLMWRESENHLNMAIEYMQQNLVIEFFLQQFDEIFR